MFTHTQHRTNSYPFPLIGKYFTVLLGVGLFLLSHSAFANMGQISNWRLAQNPHGIAAQGKTYKIRWEPIRVDAAGGHIRAKLWVANKPHCTAWTDFRWHMQPNVTNIHQNQKIRINLSMNTKKGAGNCQPPLDPYFSASVMSGWMWNKKIGGEISSKGKDLIGYASRNDIHVRASSKKPNVNVNLLIKDKTSAGYEVDARDGGFGLELHWRGNTYNVFYKFAPGQIRQQPATKPAQAPTAGINHWQLASNPHGIAAQGKTYKILWQPIRVDASGGHIRAKLWVANKPHCTAWTDYRWNLHPNVANIHQNQRITLNLSMNTKKGGNCNPPLDPYFSASVMSGWMWNKKIGGDISSKGKDLIGYASRNDIHVRASSKKPNVNINFLVKDKTSAGYEVDARDGGFGLELHWRGNTYNVFYKYAARG